jgi:hypothetical protein
MEPDFIEAAIYIPVFGCYGGEYVAACANNHCGYLGEYKLFVTINGGLMLHYQPVLLDTVYFKAMFQPRLFFSEVGVQFHKEDKVLTMSEEMKAPCPPVVLHKSEKWESAPFNKPLKQTYAIAIK